MWSMLIWEIWQSAIICICYHFHLLSFAFAIIWWWFSMKTCDSLLGPLLLMDIWVKHFLCFDLSIATVVTMQYMVNVYLHLNLHLYLFCIQICVCIWVTFICFDLTKVMVGTLWCSCNGSVRNCTFKTSFVFTSVSASKTGFLQNSSNYNFSGDLYHLNPPKGWSGPAMKEAKLEQKIFTFAHIFHMAFEIHFFPGQTLFCIAFVLLYAFPRNAAISWWPPSPSSESEALAFFFWHWCCDMLHTCLGNLILSPPSTLGQTGQ